MLQYWSWAANRYWILSLSSRVETDGRACAGMLLMRLIQRVWSGMGSELGGLLNLSKHSIYSLATQSFCVRSIQLTIILITFALLQLLFIEPLSAIQHYNYYPCLLIINSFSFILLIIQNAFISIFTLLNIMMFCIIKLKKEDKSYTHLSYKPVPWPPWMRRRRPFRLFGAM